MLFNLHRKKQKDRPKKEPVYLLLREILRFSIKNIPFFASQICAVFLQHTKVERYFCPFMLARDFLPIETFICRGKNSKNLLRK